MDGRNRRGATVLVVDDEPDVADLYTVWLETDYEVLTAYSGQEAIETVDEAVDVVLLDRQMPEYSGDEVLSELDRRQLDPWVVMVTAVNPDFDIVEMAFDDYLTKPVDREALADAVERMLERESYDETIQEFFSLSAKKATLEAEKPPAELGSDDRYRQIVRRVEELGGRADAAAAGLDEGFERLFDPEPKG